MSSQNGCSNANFGFRRDTSGLDAVVFVAAKLDNNISRASLHSALMGCTGEFAGSIHDALEALL
ncbi:MAG: hypothetical protein H6512_02300 [Acidimicrobiia bacterium]|nr:hypothetical protein [Acidimicrobiia bacterium]